MKSLMRKVMLEQAMHWAAAYWMTPPQLRTMTWPMRWNWLTRTG